jgi:hypothetical protein
MDMMIIFIITQNAPGVFPVFFDSHLWDYLYPSNKSFLDTNLYPVLHEQIAMSW